MRKAEKTKKPKKIFSRPIKWTKTVVFYDRKGNVTGETISHELYELEHKESITARAKK